MLCRTTHLVACLQLCCMHNRGSLMLHAIKRIGNWMSATQGFTLRQFVARHTAVTLSKPLVLAKATLLAQGTRRRLCAAENALRLIYKSTCAHPTRSRLCVSMHVLRCSDSAVDWIGHALAMRCHASCRHTFADKQESPCCSELWRAQATFEGMVP
jgi:hypothetical protein